MAIRLRVREAAERQGLNPTQLAERSGIAYSTVMDWWHDRTLRIDRSTLDRFCEALRVEPGELVTRTIGDVSEDHTEALVLVAA